jgi:hypothetical protein
VYHVKLPKLWMAFVACQEQLRGDGRAREDEFTRSIAHAPEQSTLAKPR